MRLYIPMGGRQYLCIENGKESRVVCGEPDPFSRVTCPPIRWDIVQDDLPYLTKHELSIAMRSEIAYTRFYEEPC